MDRTFILRSEIQCRQLYAFLRTNWSDMAAAGRPLAVTIAEAKAKRSGDQNRMLHALLREIAASAYVGGRRFSEEAWKEMIRRKFIGTEEVVLPDGARIERGISTTTLSVAEFSALIDRVCAWAQDELGIEIEGRTYA